MAEFIEFINCNGSMCIEDWGPHEEGVKLFTNQTGGYACHHPYVLGKDVSETVPNLNELAKELENYCWDVGKGWIVAGELVPKEPNYNQYTADIDAILSKYGMSLDKNRLHESEEAWFVVKIEGRCFTYIITFDNSD